MYSSLILTKTHIFKLIHLFFQNDLCGCSKQNVMVKGNNNLKILPPNEKENVYYPFFLYLSPKWRDDKIMSPSGRTTIFFVIVRSNITCVWEEGLRVYFAVILMRVIMFVSYVICANVPLSVLICILRQHSTHDIGLLEGSKEIM